MNSRTDTGIVALVTQPNPFAEQPARTLSTVSDSSEESTTPEPDDLPAEDVPEADAAWPHETVEFLGDRKSVV